MTYALFPSIKTGWGTAHLKRSVKLARELGGKVYLPLANEKGYFTKELIANIIGIDNYSELCRLAWPRKGAVIITDYRIMPNNVFLQLRPLGKIIAIDEGGECQQFADYSIDTLPRVDGSKADIFSTGFLDLPDYDKARKVKKFGNLVTFGGEDPGRLTEKLLSVACPMFIEPQRTWVILGKASGHQRLPHGVIVKKPVPDLRKILPSYDTVYCSFGLTAYEAAASGCRVVLFNRDEYHQKLSQVAGFPEIGVGSPDLRHLETYCNAPESVREICGYIGNVKRLSLSDYIKGLDA